MTISYELKLLPDFVALGLRDSLRRSSSLSSLRLASAQFMATKNPQSWFFDAQRNVYKFTADVDKFLALDYLGC